MLGDAVGVLRCPLCGAGLAVADGSVRCAHGHNFDVARHGYVSLLAGDTRTATADDVAMVAARTAFLATGSYRGLVDAVAAACARAAPPGSGCVADLGAGIGTYAAAVLERLPGRLGVALDLSKYALRRAARAHPRLAAVACDVWRPLPLRSGVAGVALCVFAPRHGAELRRVLQPGGALVVASPTRRHLGELVATLDLIGVDERKRERQASALEPHLELVAEDRWEHPLRLARADVAHLVGMGPSARHVEERTLDERIAALSDPVEVTASVIVSTYRRGRDGSATG